MSEDASDPSAPDAGVATATTVDARGGRGGADDPTRTSAAGANSAPAPARVRDDRLPAPLQYRDPERYEIIGEHGRGGLGRVLRARDRELGRDVAVKELLQRGNTSELRFFREALITARLEHPGIVPVHEAGRWPDGTPFYAMKLVQGRPLRELIDDCKTLEDRLALLPHVIAVADAISYAHDHKIIHRDLKPSNVIVGAFGETVVIDWGLAKDLASEIADPVDEGPYRTPATDGLTVAGSMLGTPAYMAPEQREGTADKRSDIYAIGGILFHIAVGAAPHRHAGDNPRDSAPSLPRGLPRDLCAIIERALSPDPGGRYASAEALGEDLRRFAQRRPVEARRYSLFARALLGAARHRALSLVLVGALATITVLLAIDRSRVDHQRARAEEAELTAGNALDTAQSSLASLRLKNAQLLLTSDPSSAIDTLADYEGKDPDAAELLRADAIGRGVSLVRAKPHRGNVLWAAGLPDGSVTTLSNDGALARTTFDGVSKTLMTGIASSGVFSYSPDRHLLAMACGSEALCVYDVFAVGPGQQPERLHIPHVRHLSFSPGGARLAVISGPHDLIVVDCSHPGTIHEVEHRSIDGGLAAFVDEQDLVIVTDDHLEFKSRSTRIPLADGTGDSTEVLAVDPQYRLVALSTAKGYVWIVDVATARVVGAKRLCDGPVRGLVFRSDAIAVFVCKSGEVAEWHPELGHTDVLFQLGTHATDVVYSALDQLLVVGTDSGGLEIFDFATDLRTSYVGHGLPITAVAIPSAGWPFLASGDSGGSIRVWPLPQRRARVVMHADPPYMDVSFGRTADAVVAANNSPVLYARSGDGPPSRLVPHNALNLFLARSPNGLVIAAYGFSSTIEVWSTVTLSRVRTLDVEHGSVSQVRLLDDSGTLVSGGEDGRLIVWPARGPERVLAQFPAPIVRFVVAAGATIIVATDDGSVSRVSMSGVVAGIKMPKGTVSRIQVADGGQTVAVGYEAGDLVLIRAQDWTATEVLRVSGVIRDIAFTTDGRSFAFSTDDGRVFVPVSNGGFDRIHGRWTTFNIASRYLAFAPDGRLFVADRVGGLWTYVRSSGKWTNTATHLGGFRAGSVAPDGHSAAVVSSTGEVASLSFVHDSL